MIHVNINTTDSPCDEDDMTEDFASPASARDRSSHDGTQHQTERFGAPIPRPWHSGGIFDPNSDTATVNIWGPTPAGASSGKVVAWTVNLKNAAILLTAVNAHEELIEALTGMLAWFGKTHREDWLHDASFAGAETAIDRARSLLTRLNEGK